MGLPGSDRTGREVATTCGADVVQHLFDALDAISAFVAANPGVSRIGRQVAVAQFAVWAQF